MRCKLTVVDPKMRSLVKHGTTVEMDGKSEQLVTIRLYWADLLLLGTLESSHGVSVRCG